MKIVRFNILIIFFLSCIIASCGEKDPCEEDMNSLECPTGDFDNDGILNSEDPDPSDACIPKGDNFESNIVGTWNYRFEGLSEGVGQILFKTDGTYEDLENTFISGTEITKREWWIQDGRLHVDSGEASLNMTWIEFSCETFTLDGESFIPNIIFTRV